MDLNFCSINACKTVLISILSAAAPFMLNDDSLTLNPQMQTGVLF